jgi:hypothetical protein
MWADYLWFAVSVPGPEWTRLLGTLPTAAGLAASALLPPSRCLKRELALSGKPALQQFFGACQTVGVLLPKGDRMPDAMEQTEGVERAEIEVEGHCAGVRAAEVSVMADVERRVEKLEHERVGRVALRGTRVNTHPRLVAEPLIHPSLNRDKVSNMQLESQRAHKTPLRQLDPTRPTAQDLLLDPFFCG